jgi:hypothetical protein
MLVVPDTVPPQLPLLDMVKPPPTFIVFPLMVKLLLFELDPPNSKVPDTVQLSARVYVELPLLVRTIESAFGHVFPFEVSVAVVFTTSPELPAIVIALTSVTFPLTVSVLFIVKVLV